MLALASSAADILTLTNQLSFEGKITRIKDCAVVFKAEGKKYVVPATEIYSIQFNDISDKVYTDYLKLSDEESDKCLNGRADADLLHGKKGGHLVLGFLFGPLAVIGTALSNPSPESGKKTLVDSKHKDLFNDPEYLNCYKKQAKGNLIGTELMGLGVWAFVLFSYRTLLRK